MPQANAAPGYGQVRLNKRGKFWYARFRHLGGRHEVALRITNKVTAETKARQINDALEAGHPWEWVVDRSRVGERTFAKALAEFLEKGARWSESTRRGNHALLEKLKTEFGARPVADISAADIEAYLARRRDEGLSKATRNRYLCTLKVILKKAHEWGYTPRNVAADLKTEREGRKQPMPYTRVEVRLLLAELEPEHRRIAEVYLHTGLRRGELAKLQWADVDWEARTIAVRDPKNDDDRTIPMSRRVYEILQEVKRERISGATTPITRYVFGPSADIWHALRRAAASAGLEEGRRHRLQHRLRDTAATTLLDAGVPLDRVQVILGHRSIEMTRRYAETRPEAIREAIAQAFDR
jgi:integrase